MRIRGWSLGVCSSDLITRRSLVQILPPQPVLGSRPIARCNWPALIWAGNFGPEIFGPKTLPFGPKTLPGNPHTRRQAANDGQQTTDKRRRATSPPGPRRISPGLDGKSAQSDLKLFVHIELVPGVSQDFR